MFINHVFTDHSRSSSPEIARCLPCPATLQPNFLDDYSPVNHDHARECDGNSSGIETGFTSSPCPTTRLSPELLDMESSPSFKLMHREALHGDDMQREQG